MWIVAVMLIFSAFLLGTIVGTYMEHNAFLRLMDLSKQLNKIVEREMEKRK